LGSFGRNWAVLGGIGQFWAELGSFGHWPVMQPIRIFRPNKANKWFVCNVSKNEEAKVWSGRSEMGGAGVWGGAAWRNWACEANCGCESSV